MAFHLGKRDERIYLEDTDRDLPAKVYPTTPYAVFASIAKGGKANIFSCKDLHLARTICYKSLRPEIAAHPVEQRRFLREARVTAMLQHPSTVPVYELGRDNRGYLYFTMKLVRGYTLGEMLDPKYRSRYDLAQLMEVVLQVARGLDFAHEHGVVHRDIKPANLLVGPAGEVLILDWGLAKIWSRDGSSADPPSDAVADVDAADLGLTGQGKLQGTVVYMSPEQIRRDADIDGRSDVYSLGAVLYEILTGRTPHGEPGERVDTVIEKVQHDEPRRPSQVAKFAVPKRIEEICMRCLRKDPGARYASAEAVVRELREGWDD